MNHVFRLFYQVKQVVRAGKGLVAVTAVTIVACLAKAAAGLAAAIFASTVAICVVAAYQIWVGNRRRPSTRHPNEQGTSRKFTGDVGAEVSQADASKLHATTIPLFEQPYGQRCDTTFDILSGQD